MTRRDQLDDLDLDNALAQARRTSAPDRWYVGHPEAIGPNAECRRCRCHDQVRSMRWVEEKSLYLCQPCVRVLGLVP